MTEFQWFLLGLTLYLIGYELFKRYGSMIDVEAGRAIQYRRWDECPDELESIDEQLESGTIQSSD